MKPILVKNSTLMTDLKSALFIEYNKERIGIHISDLIYCPRQSVFRKLTPIPVTDRELNFFTSGRSIHDAIQTLAQQNNKYEVEKEIEFIPIENEFTNGLDEIKKLNGHGKDLKILAHIDLFDKVNNIPIEAKTARKKNLKNKEGIEVPKSFNVTQLKIYMALTNSDRGYLMYQMLMNFDSNPFTIFEINMDKQERIGLLKWLTIEAINYYHALKNKDASLARHIVNDPELSWKCNDCPFLNPCMDMRNQEYIRNRK